MVSFPISTRDVAVLLEVSAHRLRYLVAQGEISPPLLLGRMAWHRAHVEAAAERLDRALTLRHKLGTTATAGAQENTK